VRLRLLLMDQLHGMGAQRARQELNDWMRLAELFDLAKPEQLYLARSAISRGLVEVFQIFDQVGDEVTSSDEALDVGMYGLGALS
jgi:hypothetical protein